MFQNSKEEGKEKQVIWILKLQDLKQTLWVTDKKTKTQGDVEYSRISQINRGRVGMNSEVFLPFPYTWQQATVIFPGET